MNHGRIIPKDDPFGVIIFKWTSLGFKISDRETSARRYNFESSLIPVAATDLNIRFSDNPGESTYNGWNIRQPRRRNILNNFEQIQYSNLPPEHPCDPTHKMGVFFQYDKTMYSDLSIKLDEQVGFQTDYSPL